MFLFLLACTIEDDPLPVLPRAPAAATQTAPPAEDYEGPETVETSEGASGPNDAPMVGQVTVIPSPPTAVSDLSVQASPTDPNGDLVNATYEWSVNGSKLISENGPTLSRDHFHRGDRVTNTIVASDGTATSRAVTEITIENSVPTITTRPENVTKVDGLQMAAKDPDGDPLTWHLEGAPYGMTINPRNGEIAFKGAKVDQGGAFTVTVVVDDGNSGTAQWRFSAEVQGGRTDEQAQLEARAASPTAPMGTPPMGAAPSAAAPATAPAAPLGPPPPPAQQASGAPIFQSANDVK